MVPWDSLKTWKVSGLMLANHTAICQLFDRCVKQQLGLDWIVEVLRFECCTFLCIRLSCMKLTSDEGDHLRRWCQDLQMKRRSWVSKGTPWTKRRDSKVGLHNCIEQPRYEKLRSRNAFLENYRQLISWPFHGKSHGNPSVTAWDALLNLEDLIPKFQRDQVATVSKFPDTCKARTPLCREFGWVWSRQRGAGFSVFRV